MASSTTTTTKSRLQSRTWTRGQYLISTDASLLNIAALMDIFDSDSFYWSKSLPPSAMREMLDSSLVFGLYELAEGSADPDAERNLLGIARCVTDFVTFAYLTDVWVDPKCQGKGLGTWLVECVREVLEAMPHLRRSVLYTGDWERSVPFYQKLLGMELLEPKHGQGLAIMERKGKGHPSYGKDSDGY